MSIFFFFLFLFFLFFLFFYALARSECFSETAMNISGKCDKCDEMRAKLRKTFHIPAALLLTRFFFSLLQSVPLNDNSIFCEVRQQFLSLSLSLAKGFPTSSSSLLLTSSCLTKDSAFTRVCVYFFFAYIRAVIDSD